MSSGAGHRVVLKNLVLLLAIMVGTVAEAQTYRTVTEYDGARRPKKVTDALGNETHIFYNLNGQVEREAKQAPGGQWVVTCITYGFTGKKVLVVGPYLTASKDTCPNANDLAVPRAEFGYDGVDRLDNETVRLDPVSGQGDRVTRTKYDAAGQVLQIKRAVGSSYEQSYVTYSYTPNGNQEFVIDARGNKAQFKWDGFDRQWCWAQPAVYSPAAFDPSTPQTALSTAGHVGGNCVATGEFEIYTYDANGNRLSLRKRDNRTITYTYDNLNRMRTKSVPAPALGSASAYSVHYGYDLRGLMTYARFSSDQGEGVTNEYDGAGRLKNSATNMGGTSRRLDYQYDEASNRKRVTHPGSTIFFSYDWDQLNRLTGISENGTTALVTPSYDTLSRPDFVTRGGSTTDYSYDAASRLSGISHDLANTSADLTLTFGYNRAGQIVTRNQSNDLYASTAHYTVNRNYTRNGLNQYTQAGPVAFTYDLNGNLKSDGSTHFEYDGENRLVKTNMAYTASLVYDPLGRLYQTSGGGAGTTRFLYDGDALVAEYDVGGNVMRRYVHGPGVDWPLIWYEGSAVGPSNRRQLFANHQRSVVAVADANGVIVGTNAYDAWGIANSTNLGRFSFTGQIVIPEAGIYHYKARSYSPTLGRFLQVDPIGYQDQINLYVYVGNDPLNVEDSTGRCRDRDVNQECLVINNAGEQGTEPTAALQAQLRELDPKILAMGDKGKISILNNEGQQIGRISRKKLKKRWLKMSWTIDPVGTTHGVNQANGAVYGYNVRFTADKLAGYEAAAAWAGGTAGDGLTVVILHEVGHKTPYGMNLTKQFPVGAHPPGTPGHDMREQGATSAGRAIANEIGQTFICQVVGECE